MPQSDETRRLHSRVPSAQAEDEGGNHSVAIHVWLKPPLDLTRIDSLAGYLSDPDAYAQQPFSIGIHRHSASMCTTLNLSLAGDSLGLIVKLEWNIDSTGYVEGSGPETTIVSPQRPADAFSCALRVTDDDGNVAEHEITFAVGYWDAPDSCAWTEGEQQYYPLTSDGEKAYVVSEEQVDHYRKLLVCEGEAWEALCDIRRGDDIMALKVRDGVPYIAYYEEGNLLTLMKYADGDWRQVGALSGVVGRSDLSVQLALGETVGYLFFAEGHSWPLPHLHIFDDSGLGSDVQFTGVHLSTSMTTAERHLAPISP